MPSDQMPDDARLTAYALGELDPADAAAVEQQLATDPAARATVEQVRATAGVLEDALAAEAGGDAAGIADRATTGRVGFGRGRVLAFAAAAVLLGGGLAIGILATGGIGSNKQVALSARSAEAKDSAVADAVAEARSRHGRMMFSADEDLSLGEQPSPVANERNPELLAQQHAMRQALRSLEPSKVPASPAPDARLRGDVAGVATDEFGAMADDHVAPKVMVEHLVPIERDAGPFSRDAYDRIVDNPFISPAESPLSTFGVDVDTASYANVRRYLNDGQLPPPDAVRIEEMINSFKYGYEAPQSLEEPLAVKLDVASAPWNPEHRLVRVALQAYENQAERPAANLVFLVDISGSMSSPDKLGLVKQGLRTLVAGLDDKDTVAIVAYAGNSGLVLPATSGNDQATLLAAIDRLDSGGSTNGAAGIFLAYQQARAHFIDGGINRVILATDGDFNVGTTDTGSLTRLVEEQAKTGVFLSVLGFGRGNLNDAMMEQISNNGDGFYAYIDGPAEADRVLSERMLSTVQAVAKDVKLQVEFNPGQVAAYRLIGYANRLLADRDFADDTKDAGDVGAGHQVTAFYEIVPAGVEFADGTPGPTTLKYQSEKEAVASNELLTVKLRWKQPDEAKEQGTSDLREFPLIDAGGTFEEADPDFQFAATVAAFGMLLRDSEHKGSLTWAELLELTAFLDALKDMEHSNPELTRREDYRFLVERAAALAEPAGD